MEIRNSKVDYTIDKQFYDGRKHLLEERIERIKQKLHTIEEKEGSTPQLSQMIAQVTGLGSRLDIII